MQGPQTLNPSLKGPRASPVIRNLGGFRFFETVIGFQVSAPLEHFPASAIQAPHGALFHEISCLLQVHGFALRTVRRFLLLATLASPAYQNSAKHA